MPKTPIRIDSRLEGFLHAVFRTVVPVYPGKAPGKRKAVQEGALTMFDAPAEAPKLVMTAPFAYGFGSAPAARPCLLVLVTASGAECLPGRTCDFRQGLPNGVVYQVGIEGDFFAPNFKKAIRQVMQDGDATLATEPDYSFLPKLVNAFPALGKEVNKLEEERRVWKIEQLDDPAYLKTVDRALKRVLDKLFVVGKDATDKKGVYQSGINSLMALQKANKARLDALAEAADFGKAQVFQYLAGVVKTIHAGEAGLGEVKRRSDEEAKAGTMLQDILAEYFRWLAAQEKKTVTAEANVETFNPQIQPELAEIEKNWKILFNSL